MENPATWGLAENTVRDVLAEFFENKAKPITDESKTICGLSLERQITDALRKTGLLKEGS